jgi:hypothetical protein
LVRNKLKWWPGEWKSDFWLLVLILAIAFFFIGGHMCTGK